MAHVVRNFSIDTDRLLEGLDVEWHVGVDTTSRWAALSDFEQVVFVEEWAIARDYFHQLLERSERGELSPAQQRRFDELRAWFAPHRSAVEAVFEDSAI